MNTIKAHSRENKWHNKSCKRFLASYSKNLITVLELICGMILTTTNAFSSVFSLQTTFSHTFPNTLAGTNVSYTITVPPFDQTLGLLNDVRIGHISIFDANAESYGNGGIYIIPYFEASWVWSVDFFFQLVGPGVSILTTGNASTNGIADSESLYKSAIVNAPYQGVPYAEQEVASTNVILSTYYTSTAVELTFTAVETTAVYPLPATVAGFSWVPNTFTVTSAAINGSFTTTVYIYYDYTPYLPTPPLFSNVAVVGGNILLSLTNVNSGQTVILQGSTNMVTWIPLQTNTASGTTMFFTNNCVSNIPGMFYRTLTH